MTDPLQPPVTSPDALDLTDLTTARRLLVALDFDGVIAPLKDDPGASRPLPESARAVEALVQLLRTPVGYISGRSMEALKLLSQAPANTLFIGSHGLETDFSALPALPEDSESSAVDALSTGTSATGSAADAVAGYSAPLTEEEAETLRQLDAAFADIQERTPDAGQGELRIEPKPLGRTAHTRGSSPDRLAYFTHELAAVAGRMPQLRSFAGHAMTEFAVRMETKGHGLARMIAATRPDAVLFLGDDLTDEDAFAHLRGRPQLTSLTIKVGPQETCATHRIADPEAVARLLTRLAAERERALEPDRDLGDGERVSAL